MYRETTTSYIVELEGVEPSSKHVAKILSTRLSFVCLSVFVWYKAKPLTKTYPLKFRFYTEEPKNYLHLSDASCRPP